MPSAGRAGVLWPAPVDHDACFAAAGFRDFADTTPAWDADFATLLANVVAYFSEKGAGYLAAGEAPPPRYASPSPLVAALAAPARDDTFPWCEVRFGVPAALRIRTGAGHPLLFLWAEVLDWRELLEAVGAQRPVTRLALEWERLT